MKEAIKQLKKLSDTNLTLDTKQLKEFILSDFIEINNCILLKSLVDAKNIKSRLQTSIEDPEWFEEFENHKHVDDLIKSKRYEPIFMLQVGIMLAEILKNKLSNKYPNFSFVILISYNVFIDKGEYRSCRLSFHKIRTDPFAIIGKNLEGYKSEAVGLILSGN
jgi:hypothetical protein